ncbi:lytic transglycosylase domain-containing protein [Terrabacter sp. BE26]|uniref:aggregation-promoting factor C-terminal-like domain-containing protein n=1 Tax=Terrabacter sp. BE26 TaxID=2898152 RepID=UPI0035BE3288
MARYEGRHRSAPAPSTAPRSDRATPTARPGRGSSQTHGQASSSGHPASHPGGGSAGSTSSTRRGKSAPRRRHFGRPVLAGALALGLGASGFAYAKANDLMGADTAAFVVGNGVVAQTDELARASTVDTTYRAAASVSRNERRTALAATGSRTAKELEAKQKLAAAKQAEQARAAAAKAARDKERQRVTNNSLKDPQSAARILMADHGWSSDAQYNCLVNLWNGESDWRWSAENPSSGAYGIPQSLPASKMSQFGADYRTNPLTQIKWGLWYIEMSYGNPCNAWSTWQARSPHWY